MTGLHVVFALRGREDDVTGRKLFTSLRLEHADTVTDAVSRTLSFHSSSLPHAVNCERFCFWRRLLHFCLCMKYLGNR